MNPAGPVGKSLTHTTFFTLLSARATPPVSYRPAISSSSSTAHAPTHYCARANTLTRWMTLRSGGSADPANPVLDVGLIHYNLPSPQGPGHLTKDSTWIVATAAMFSQAKTGGDFCSFIYRCLFADKTRALETAGFANLATGRLRQRCGLLTWFLVSHE